MHEPNFTHANLHLRILFGVGASNGKFSFLVNFFFLNAQLHNKLNKDTDGVHIYFFLISEALCRNATREDVRCSSFLSEL